MSRFSSVQSMARGSVCLSRMKSGGSMCQCKGSGTRLDFETATNKDIFFHLCELNDAAKAVAFLLLQEPDGVEVLHALDGKHLYGKRIWEVFSEVCGRDLDRFKYHVDMELPCQLCGELGILGPYASTMTDAQVRAFLSLRPRAKPGSFWALKRPPKTPKYKYPLKAA